jgi:site-specific DNA recombinase
VKSVALYARVSSEKQAREATVDSQVAALKHKAEADGHLVLPSDIYVDEGISGATLVRPALERLRDRAWQGGLDIIYVHSPDRLARRYAYQVVLLEEFQSHGVSVRFVTGPETQSAEDELLVQVQGMIAEYERAKIAERCRRGKLHRARQGCVNPLGGAPYGYLYTRKSDQASASYQVLLAEARVVRQVFDWLVLEQRSIGEIVRRLNHQQVPTKRGAARWDRSTVWALLRNPAYIGKAAFGKTEAVESRVRLRTIRGRAPTARRAKGAHKDKPAQDWITIPVPAIVSEDLFAAAAEQLKRNQRLSERNGRGKRYLLQGLTVCACCGYAFYGKTVSPAANKHRRVLPHAYYRCLGTDAYRFVGGRLCNNPQVRVDQLDQYVWDSICAVLQDPSRVASEWSTRATDDGVATQLRTQRDDAARVVASQQRALQRLLDAYEAGALELEELNARSQRLRARITESRTQLDQADQQLAQTIELHAIVTRLEDFAGRVRTGLKGLSWEQRRDLIRTLVARVEIGEAGATVVYRIPSFSGPSCVQPPESGPNSTGSLPAPQVCQLRGGSPEPIAVEHRARRAGPGAREARAPLRKICGRL